MPKGRKKVAKADRISMIRVWKDFEFKWSDSLACVDLAEFWDLLDLPESMYRFIQFLLSYQWGKGEYPHVHCSVIARRMRVTTRAVEQWRALLWKRGYALTKKELIERDLKPDEWVLKGLFVKLRQVKEAADLSANSGSEKANGHSHDSEQPFAQNEQPFAEIA